MRLQKKEKEKHDLQQQLQKKHKELTKVKESHAQTCERLQEQETAVRVKREKLSHAEAQQREQAIAYKQQLQKTQGEIKAAEGQVKTLREGLHAKQAELDAKEEKVEELRCCCLVGIAFATVMSILGRLESYILFATAQLLASISFSLLAEILSIIKRCLQLASTILAQLVFHDGVRLTNLSQSRPD
eukprot:g5309.t1